jgi:hypothetical protein
LARKRSDPPDGPTGAPARETGAAHAARRALTHENAAFTKALLDSQIGALFARTNHPDLAAFENARALREELLALRDVQYIAFANLENQFHAQRAGTLSDDEWSTSDALLRKIYRSSRASRMHGAAFVALVHERLRAFAARGAQLIRTKPGAPPRSRSSQASGASDRATLRAAARWRAGTLERAD